MPAPVSFNLSLAPLPNNFAGTPQQLATAIVDRLTVTPTAPWASFQNGGTIPTSDVGPVLFNGTEWRVYDTGLGAYTFATQNGAGLVNNTVTLPKLIGGTAGSLYFVNSSGRPAELLASTGSEGQYLTLTSGSPAWTSPPSSITSTYFEVTRSGSSQQLSTTGVDQIVQFNLVRFQNNVVFDVTNNRLPVTAGSVWMFYASLQVEDDGAPSTEVQFPIYFKPVNNPGYFSGGTTNVSTVNSRFGVNTQAVMIFPVDDFVQIHVVPTEATPSADGLAIANNGESTRWGGFRIV